MKTLYKILAISLIIFATACEDNMSNEFPIPQDNTIKVTAYSDDAAQTKTGIIDKTDGGKSVVWKSGNAISLFVNSGNNGGTQLTTTNNGPVAEFTGSGTIPGGSNNYWGLYPYNANASCNGSSITTILPSSQSAYQGDVADNLLVTVGKSENLSIYFKNTCAVIGFTLSQENISKVTFYGRNDEYVAGEFTASFDGSNNLVVIPTNNAVKSIEITPAESSTFATGTTYYFAILPQSFEYGYTLTFMRNDNTIAKYERTTAFKFTISTFYTMTNKDEGKSFSNTDYVDLGLSVKWATCNLGSAVPEGSGNYYAWGETLTKSTFNDETYKWWDYSNSSYSIFKYVIKDTYTNSYYGPLDYRYVLETGDDAVSVMLGDDWRIPTRTEAKELIDNCEWLWQNDYNGASGYLVTSKVEGYTDKSIFLPLTGFMTSSSLRDVDKYGIYWFANIYECDPIQAWGMVVFNPDHYSKVIDSNTWVRSQGATIRPVFGKRKEVTSINLNKSSLEIEKGQQATITATIEPNDAPGFGIIWKSSNESIVTVSDASTIDTYSRNLKATVVAVEIGEATIIAESVDTGVQVTCHVIVGGD